ncbi:uncharacterized protein LOC128810743 isoform X1 [Vidua macroura]|uniref:uncharacterized protein LOC128810743 isoform X1 n=1 Tax=Vidua macroura TaxID=187451 RepID=UPI0023A7E558|nr:uncharacterized protein LOC128810743 isoform X1 [Vidua macroura]
MGGPFLSTASLEKYSLCELSLIPADLENPRRPPRGVAPEQEGLPVVVRRGVGAFVPDVPRAEGPCCLRTPLSSGWYSLCPNSGASGAATPSDPSSCQGLVLSMHPMGSCSQHLPGVVQPRSPKCRQALESLNSSTSTWSSNDCSLPRTSWRQCQKPSQLPHPQISSGSEKNLIFPLQGEEERWKNRISLLLAGHVGTEVLCWKPGC